MDHGRFGPQGALGGGDGGKNRVEIIRNGETLVPEHLSKAQDIPLAPGDRVRVRTPGGGGYGDPAARDRAAVAEDVRLGRYTPEEAAPPLRAAHGRLTLIPPDPHRAANAAAQQSRGTSAPFVKPCPRLACRTGDTCRSRPASTT